MREFLVGLDGCSELMTTAVQTIYSDRAMKISIIRSFWMRFSVLVLTCLAVLSATAQTKPVPNPQLASKELNARVEALLKKMTLDEKIGQLVQFSAGYATGPGASNLKYEELAAKGQVGSMLNVTGAEATNHYQHIAVEKSRLHIPILFGLDVIHGHRTTFRCRWGWRQAGIRRRWS